MDFKLGDIHDVVISKIDRFHDARGWLFETFRVDEIKNPYQPVMGYTSLTEPYVSRGPHEHKDQADYFVFAGPGTFRIWLWDNRKDSPTYWVKQVLDAGLDNPIRLLVPPGVVHCYKNISPEPALVHNYPNQLYRGEKKAYPIDEIRHEDDPNTPFQLN